MSARISRLVVLGADKNTDGHGAEKREMKNCPDGNVKVININVKVNCGYLIGSDLHQLRKYGPGAICLDNRWKVNLMCLYSTLCFRAEG